MARGLTWQTYTADDGSLYSKLADLDESLDPTRGWLPVITPDPAPVFPIQSKPRMVYGVSPTTGRRGHTIVARTDADLWTGVATSFVVRTNSQGEDTDTMNVTRRRGESFAVPHA